MNSTVNYSVVENLRKKGFRITKVREKLLEFLFTVKKPVSVTELVRLFYKKDISVNKTTIYREIEFLKQNNLVREIEFGDGKRRYEAEDGDHHHHIVCVNCGFVADVELKVDLGIDEDRIRKETGFKISEHAIELFGLCKSCQH